MAEKHHCTDLTALLWIFATLMFEQLRMYFILTRALLSQSLWSN